MSLMEGNGLNPSTSAFNSLTNKDNTRPLSLVEYIEDDNRTAPLIGLQYVTELKVAGSNKSFLKCSICRVKGYLSTMLEHLGGLHHIKAYMEMYYFSELKSIKYSQNKGKVGTLIRDFAREIERAEGAKSVQIEYISAADMSKEAGNWLNEKDGDSKFGTQLGESTLLDKRQLALKYSETFKISSRAEATIVLKLTEQLSNNLEQYFLKCKGLEQVLDTGKADSRPESFEPPPNIVPPSIYGNTDSSKNLGFEMTPKNPVLNEVPSTSSMHTLPSAHSFESFRGKLPDSEEQIRREVPSRQDAFPESSSGSGSPGRKRRKFEDPNEIPFMSSSLALPPVAVPSSSITTPFYSEYKDNRVSEPKPGKPESFGSFQRHQKAEYRTNVGHGSRSSVTATGANLRSKPTELPRSPERKVQAPLDVDNEEDYLYNSPPHSSNAEEPHNSNQSQGKACNSLSPDILELLKGKDESTVTNILKTLAPFYPALQEIDLEILSQVLVNTGALD